jgi:hypothetical protein
MSFRKINEGGAEGPDGVVVQIKGPEILEYRWGDRVALIGVDYDPTKKLSTVQGSDVKYWEGAGTSALIPADVRQKIAQDLLCAVALLKGNFVVA